MMEINDKFETIKTGDEEPVPVQAQTVEQKESMTTTANGKEAPKVTVVTLSNESTSNSSAAGSLTSSQSNIDSVGSAKKPLSINECLLLDEASTKLNSLNEKEANYTASRRQLASNSNTNMTTAASNSIYGTPRRQSSVFGTSTPIFYDDLMGGGNFSLDPNTVELNDDLAAANANKGCCLDCGCFAYLNKFNDLQLCDGCYQKHWQNEVNELIKYKSYLENNVRDLKKYLAAKRSQCNENIKSSHQIKKFINMTMQQIKRKVELELENKRDELLNSIDLFVENQKKISSSINEDTFQTSDRICNEIENLLLNSDDVNLLKLKSVKTFAKSQISKLNQQKSSRIPLYSIFFVPDSTVQVNNTFGKILLKSYDVDTAGETNSYLGELDDMASNASIMGDDEPITNAAEFSFLNNNSATNHFDASQIFNKLQPKPAQHHYQTNSYNQYNHHHHQYPSKWTSIDNIDNQFDTNLTGMPGYATIGRPSRAAPTANYKSNENFNLNTGYVRRHKAFLNKQITPSQRLAKAMSVHNAFELDDSSSDAYEMDQRLNAPVRNVHQRLGQGREEPVYETYSSRDNDFNQENNIVSAKPFVPAKVLMSQNTPTNNNPVNQVKLKFVKNADDSTKNNVKLNDQLPKKPINFSTSSESTQSASSPSMPSSPSSPQPNNPTLANETTLPQPTQQQQPLSFKQQLLNQAPKLVEF